MQTLPSPASPKEGFWRRAARKFADFAYAMDADETDLLARRIDGLEVQVRTLSSRVGAVPPAGDEHPTADGALPR